MTEAEAGWKPIQMPARGYEIAFEAYGVRLAIGGSHPEIIERARAYLPPGWKPCAASDAQRRFDIRQEMDGSYTFMKDGENETLGLSLDLSILLLDTQLRLFIARKAPDVIFVHAGVVAHRGKAIVLPGVSFAGKTTLVAALVGEGAHYYSDEFAVLDDNGLVHPYTKPLSLRDEHHIQTDHAVESLGGFAGDEPLPVGLIAVTSYKPRGQWNPRRMTAGEGAMALLANTVPARERPEESLHAVRLAVEGAIVLESERGEADALAPLLLAELER